MIVISHRGNLKGSNPSEENGLDYIDKALTNYDVEIDLRIKNKKFFLLTTRNQIGHAEWDISSSITNLNKKSSPKGSA